MTRVTRSSLVTAAENRNSGGNSDYVKAWNFGQIDFDTTAVIRLVPWVDAVEKFVYTQKILYPMSFKTPGRPGVVTKFNAPSVSMYLNDHGEYQHDPMGRIINDLWKEIKAAEESDPHLFKTLKDVASLHRPMRSYLYLGFIIDDGKGGGDANTLVPISLTKTVHKKINNDFTAKDSQYKELPIGEYGQEDIAMFLDSGDVPEGAVLEVRDLRITKTKGADNYPNYDAQWSVDKELLAREQMMAYIEHPLNLDNMKQKVSPEDAEGFAKMLTASIDNALGLADAEWKQEWTEAGLRSYEDAGGGSGFNSGGNAAGGGSLAARLAARLNGGGGASASSAPATTESASTPPSGTTSAPAERGVSSLMDRVKAKDADPSEASKADAPAETPSEPVKKESGSSLLDRMRKSS